MWGSSILFIIADYYLLTDRILNENYMICKKI